MEDVYDDIVVGSGVSGMTIALLLAKSGRKVLLLEKSRVIGGSLQCFRRAGVPFDTGFHFSTNFTGCMGDMIRVLGLSDSLVCLPINTKIILTDSGKTWDMPHGREESCSYLCRAFPDNVQQIRDYFAVEKKIFDGTTLFDLRTPGGFTAAQPLDEDFITLAEYLDSLHLPPELRTLLASFATCHGTPPSEISLANHCRVSYGLLDDLVRVRGGGSAFIRAFLREAQKLGIVIRTGTTIGECLDVEHKRCHKVRLRDGTEVRFENCVMTIHPKAIAQILPQFVQTEDFRKRISEFTESCGFFTIFGVLDPEASGFQQELSSCFSVPDIDAILSGKNPEATATAIMLTQESGDDGREHQLLTAFQSVFPEETRLWQDTRTGHRPESYHIYKMKKAQKIMRTVLQVYPEFENYVRILDTASMLTFRDYLSPFGSAYGIRQRMNQNNLFGKLPLRNFYVIGQSALLPGMMGAMLSAFIIWRKMTGEETYMKLLEQA